MFSFKGYMYSLKIWEIYSKLKEAKQGNLIPASFFEEQKWLNDISYLTGIMCTCYLFAETGICAWIQHQITHPKGTVRTPFHLLWSDPRQLDQAYLSSVIENWKPSKKQYRITHLLPQNMMPLSCTVRDQRLLCFVSNHIYLYRML